MNELEKLRVLLPHWIEHNRGHAEECSKWAELAAQGEGEGAGEVELNLKAALVAMEVVSEHLEMALSAAGGAKAHGGNGHHHH